MKKRPSLSQAMLERRENRLQMREDRLTGKANAKATIAAQAAEIERLLGVLKRVTPDPVWGEDPRTRAYYQEARATLNPQEEQK